MRLFLPFLAAAALAVVTIPAQAETGPVRGVAKGTATVATGVAKGTAQAGKGLARGTATAGKGVARGTATAARGTGKGLCRIFTLGRRC